ncbi:MAG: hypothetical protein R8F63_01150 [Acidimicrobiales bacterium]|nr:hypothetical protein [Acidimicrobiales bacterium]
MTDSPPDPPRPNGPKKDDDDEEQELEDWIGTEWEENLPESVIPDLEISKRVITGGHYPPDPEAETTEPDEADADAGSELPDGELEFSDLIGDKIRDFEEAIEAGDAADAQAETDRKVKEVLDEQRELLDKIEADKRRQNQLEEDRRTEPERERQYQIGLWWRRIVVTIGILAGLGYGCSQVLGDDGETTVAGGGDPTADDTAAEDSATDGGTPSEPVEDPTGDGEVATDPSGSRPPLACAVGDASPDAAALAAEEAAIRERADQEFVEERLGSTAGAVVFENGSYVFTMTVLGDGESVAMGPSTRWYNPRFVVNNDPATNTYDPGGGFAVDVNFSGGDVRSNVFDEDFAALPAEQATVDAVWLDPSTLQVTATIDGPQLEVTRMRVEMSVRLQDADGNETATFGNDACWTAS